MSSALTEFFKEGFFASVRSITIVDDNAASPLIGTYSATQLKQEPSLLGSSTCPFTRSGSMPPRRPRSQRASSNRRVPRKERQRGAPAAGCRWEDTSSSAAAQETTNTLTNRRRGSSLDSSSLAPRMPMRRSSTPKKKSQRHSYTADSRSDGVAKHATMVNHTPLGNLLTLLLASGRAEVQRASVKAKGEESPFPMMLASETKQQAI